MSYGDNSYGEICYADDSIIGIIIRTIRNITAIFVSKEKIQGFVSKKKDGGFFS